VLTVCTSHSLEVGEKVGEHMRPLLHSPHLPFLPACGLGVLLLSSGFDLPAGILPGSFLLNTQPQKLGCTEVITLKSVFLRYDLYSSKTCRKSQSM
jgi:hypothetical protein